VPERLLDCPEIKKSISQNVGKLLAVKNENEREKFEQENDRLCYELFGLSDDQRNEIEATLVSYS
jgi:uncharacterized protein Veg